MEVKISKPPPTIFTQNHLGYVMSSMETLRAYMIHSLHIDEKFIDHFTNHDWVSALEHTLHCRPPEIPTETYLKSQHLWIVHKLLIRAGLRDQIQSLMSTMSANDAPVAAPARLALSAHLDHFQERIHGTHSISSVFDELYQTLENFYATHGPVLMQEKQAIVERRCDIIRWFSWVLCEGGESWLKTSPYLEQGFKHWIKNPPSPIFIENSIPRKTFYKEV